MLAGVVEVPEFRPLPLGVPAVLGRPERKHALLGAGLLLVTPRAAEGSIEPVLVERLLESLGLHHVGVYRRPMGKGANALGDAFRVHVHEQVETEPAGRLVPEADHFPELPGRVDMQEWEGRLGRVEGLHGQMQHHRAVLADRIEHHRLFALGDHLPHDVDGLGFEAGQMGQMVVRAGSAGCGHFGSGPERGPGV